MNAAEHPLANLRKAVSRISASLDRIDAKVDVLDAKLDALDAKVDSGFDRLTSLVLEVLKK